MKIDTVLVSQVVKFLLTGILNTFIDLGVLNSLVFIFDSGINTLLYLAFKTISFLIAVINSYYLNKNWTFNSKTGNQSDFIYFLIVSATGLLINVIVATLVFNLLTEINLTHILFSINISAIIGTVVVLVWNFIGYKFFVFKIKKYE
jgi:putative flippase GtrA